MKNHVQGFHEKDKGWNKCNICQKNFYGKCGLKRHVKNVHEGVRIPCPEPECDYKATNSQVLKEHQATDHKGVKHHCPVAMCDFVTTKYKSNLYHHIKMKHKEKKEELPYESFFCNQCDYKTTKNINLYNHVRNIHNGKKYKCNKCGKEFNHPGSLTEHNKAIHEGFLYACNECDQKFKYRPGLRLHIKNEHRGITSDCTKCGRKCSNDFDLKRHFKIHGDADIFCKMCNYSCKQQNSLRAHVKSVHGGGSSFNYPCHICDLEAKSVDELKNHIISNHSMNYSKEIQPTLEENSPSKEDIFPKQDYCDAAIKTEKN